MKKFLLIIGILSLVASAVMYFVGKDSSHLSELYDLFWLPLPLSALALAAASKVKKKESTEGS